MIDIDIKVDEKEVRRLYLEEIEKHLKKVSTELTFWDTKELKRRTCMSWNTITSTFFYDPRFPKYKVGGKWLFPAKKTEEFLVMWLEEQK